MISFWNWLTGIEWVKISPAIAAFCALFTALLMVFSDFFRYWLCYPRVKMSLKPRRVTHYSVNGKELDAIYSHIEVVNTRRWVPIRCAKVRLDQIERVIANGRKDVTPQMPLQLKWAPSGTKETKDIPYNETADFVSLTKPRGECLKGGEKFHPILFTPVNNIEAHVGKDETVIYTLRVEADGFVSKPVKISVFWDGSWPTDPSRVDMHLSMQIIKK